MTKAHVDFKAIGSVLPAALTGLAVLAPLAVLAAAPVLARSDKLPRILSVLQHGRWDLRPVGRGAKAATRSMCVRPNLQSIAIVHGGKGKCSVYINEDHGGEAAFSYHCSSGDQGMTRVRSESAKLVVIDTQGIDGGEPFHIRYEGRYAGGC